MPTNIQALLGKIKAWTAPERLKKSETVSRRERRQWVRYYSDAATLYQPAEESDEPNLAACVRDICYGGVGLRVRQKHQPGELLHVELPRSHNERCTSMLTCIIHVSDVNNDDDYCLGCSFIRELTDDELGTFL